MGLSCFRSKRSHYYCCRIMAISATVAVLCVVVSSSTKDASTQAGALSDRVAALPGLTGEVGTQFAGYASIYGDVNPLPSGAEDQKLFYWFVGRDRADYTREPTIIWTNGGPGATSFWGFFLENGPYTVSGSDNAPELIPRPHAWNQFANYMIFDHPLGVGLSNVSESEEALPHNAPTGVDQLYQAFLNFLELHPAIMQNPIILAGESYAGTYLPLFAKAIMRGNTRFGHRLDLRTMMIGDGWVNPWVQMASVSTYAVSHGLISKKQKQHIDTLNKTQAANAVSQISGVNLANIASPIGVDDGWNAVKNYLNRKDVRRAIHANLMPPLDSWSSVKIGQLYASSVNDNFQGVVQELLDDGLQTIVVSGLLDAKDCNFIGTEAWLDMLTGDVAANFHAADPVRWKSSDGQLLGYIQESNSKQLSFVKVRHAGHMAAGEQPLLIDLIMNQSAALHDIRFEKRFV